MTELSLARRAFLDAISHIRTAWVQGCHCEICTCVDRRFTTLVSLRRFGSRVQEEG